MYIIKKTETSLTKHFVNKCRVNGIHLLRLPRLGVHVMKNCRWIGEVNGKP